MASRVTFEKTSHLGAPADEVWMHATRMPSINCEMGPWLQMTYPPEAETLTLSDAGIELGKPLFESWILFLGKVPVDRFSLTLVEIEEGRRFVEASRSKALKSWRHERVVEPEGRGCSVTDRISFEPPLFLLSPVLGSLISMFFDHRHRQLERAFGSTSSASLSPRSEGGGDPVLSKA